MTKQTTNVTEKNSYKLMDKSFWDLGASIQEAGNSLESAMSKYGVDMGSSAHADMLDGFNCSKATEITNADLQARGIQ